MAETSHYDKNEADFVCTFIEQLRHTKGEFYQQPFELIDWQEQIIRDVFGILKSDGYRQFNTVYIEVPKKCGKSELAAAVALYMLCADGEQGAEVYSCASDRDQASIVFTAASRMVEMCPQLRSRCKVLHSRKTILYKPTDSKYVALSSDVGGKSGVNVSALIFDELWVQKDREFFDMMTKGTSDARKNPLHFIITTAGNDTNSVCFEMHQKAVDVLAGRKHDKTFYPVIYGAGMDEDWSDPDVWKKANPSLGFTIGVDKVEAAYESARENPAEENAFRQLRLDQWVSQAVRWMPMHKWDACAYPVDPEELAGRICYGGLDLSMSVDLTAFSLVFPPTEEGGRYVVLPFFWIPEERMAEKIKKDHVPYDMWKRTGKMMTTPGEVIDYNFVEAFIEELGKKYRIYEFAFDPYNASMLTQNLSMKGFTAVQYRQGVQTMSNPTKELYRLVFDGKLAHGGHPVLRWNMDNVVVQEDAHGNIMMHKGKSNKRIDGAVATVMALDLAMRNGAVPQESVYDTRGIISW